MKIDRTTSLKSEEKQKWKSVSLSDERFDEFGEKNQDNDELNHEKGLFKKRHGLKLSRKTKLSFLYEIE